MDFIPHCPHCGKEISAYNWSTIDCYNDIRDGIPCYVEINIGYCNNCMTDFSWANIYNFDHYEVPQVN